MNMPRDSNWTRKEYVFMNKPRDSNWTRKEYVFMI